MRKLAGTTVLLWILALLTSSNAITGEVPQTILYQGRLTDMSGRPLIDLTTVTFAIYEAATGGASIWTETHDLRPDDFGLFAAELGSTMPLDGSVIDGRRLFLGITIANSTEMLPRQVLTSVPYAVKAGVAQTIDSTARLDASIIEGTAATLSGDQIFTGQSEFRSQLKVTTGNILVSDSLAVNAGALIHIEKISDSVGDMLGLLSKVTKSTQGDLTGVRAFAKQSKLQTDGLVYGVSGTAVSVGLKRFGLWGMSRSTIGAPGSGESYGVWGEARDGQAAYGVYGTAADADTNWAGYFAGNVRVTGTITEGAGRIQIDHPLDPENKYLIHNQVESPDMMTIYNGNVTLDDAGRATVDLPDYFDSLSSNYRYQLTAIGSPAPNLHVARTIARGRFEIAGGSSGLDVSWMVTGIRRDAYARAHRTPNESDKPKNEQGKLLHPEAFGQPIENGINFDGRTKTQKGIGH